MTTPRPNTNRNEDLERRTAYALLVLLLAIGAGLRFVGLDEESLWYDEIASWYTSGHERLTDVALADREWHLHPPGYHALLHFVQRWLGDNETALRFPSAIFGVLCIPAMYLLGARIYSRREGLIAAGLVAVLLQPVYFSQEARPYAGLLFFVLAASYLWTFLRGSLDKPVREWIALAVGYWFVCVLACYWHYFGLLFIGLQGIALAAVAVRTQPALLRWLALYAAIAAAYVPWLPSMLGQMRHALGYPPPAHSMPVEFLHYLYFLYNHSTKLLPLALALYAWLLARAFWNIYQNGNARVRTLTHSAGFWLTLWLVVPFLIAFLKSSVSASVLTHKNLLISLPPAYLLLARAIEMLPFRPMLRAAAAAALIALAFYRLVFVSDYYRAPQKEQFREAVHYIVEHDRNLGNSLIIGHHWFPSSFNYYFEQFQSDRRIDLFAAKKHHIGELTATLDARNPAYVWFICAYPKPGSAMDEFLGDLSPQADPEFLATLQQDYEVNRHEQFIGVEVYLFERQDPASSDAAR